jgi:hypothetical protein
LNLSKAWDYRGERSAICGREGAGEQFENFFSREAG